MNLNPGQVQGEASQKIRDFRFPKSDFKPFHASFKRNNQT